MIHTELPIPRAFRALQDIARSQGVGPEESLAFALTWMAAGRMALSGNVPGISRSADLATEQAWTAVAEAGLPIDVFKWWLILGSKKSGDLLAKACLVIQELVTDLGNQPWDVLPALTAAAMESRYGAEGMLSSEVSELMLDILGKPSNFLWVPFDRWGVLTIRALRRGWSVKAVPMLANQESTLALLLTIEYGQPSTHMLETEVERDPEGRPLTKADFILAVPPFGMSVRATKLAQWDSSAGEGLERYMRSEAWVMYELVNRVSKKAVFLVPPALLFSRGQEQRLREYLLHHGGECNELQSVVALPRGALLATNIASALVTMSPGQDNRDVLMVDLGLSRRSLANVDELIRVHRDLVLGRVADDKYARRVTREEIRDTENSFAPSRYLGKLVEVGSNAISLDDLCEVFRAPVLSRERDAIELVEMGIADLAGWNPVADGLEKVARLRPRRDIPTLQEGDLVLSIKGTIGKVSLVGAIRAESVVVSQNCLGLRVRPSQRALISPEYLLMYLRSEAGQVQLQSLQAGSAIQHISPQTLLSSFRVPVPEAEERSVVENDYRCLCQLEKEISHIQQQMKEIASARWTT